MPRIPRIVSPGEPHHVVQRGNNRQKVYFDDEDYRFYLNLLRAQALEFGLRTLAFCLMPNHVHLIVVPKRQDSLAKGIGRLHYYFARRRNQRSGGCGHVWQNRFYSCVLDAAHFVQAARYIERNPVRAGMRSVAWAYPWSSASAHIRGADRWNLLDMDDWSRRMGGMEWKKFLTLPEEMGFQAEFRTRTQTGRPLGSRSWGNRVVRAAGVSVSTRRVGRPRLRREDEKNR